jgi:hypothetical protein
MAENAKQNKKSDLRLSQRLRGIGHAPKDFDYKKEKGRCMMFDG